MQDLRAPERMLLSVLVDYDGLDDFFPGIPKLTVASGLSRRGVLRGLDTLEAKGWIKRSRRAGRDQRNLYKIDTDRIRAEATKHDSMVARLIGLKQSGNCERQCQDDTTPVPGWHHDSARVTPPGSARVTPQGSVSGLCKGTEKGSVGSAAGAAAPFTFDLEKAEGEGEGEPTREGRRWTDADLASLTDQVERMWWARAGQEVSARVWVEPVLSRANDVDLARAKFVEAMKSNEHEAFYPMVLAICATLPDPPRAAA